MTLKLFHASESLGSQKVKLVLAEKNLEWESHLLNLLTFENLDPSYVRLNPTAVVPTLVHGDRVITNSDTIVEYLNKQFPNPKLAFTEPKLQAQMNHWIDLQNQLPMRELIYGSSGGIEGVVLRRSVRLKEKLLSQLTQTHPELKEQYSAKLKDVRQWNSTIQNEQELVNINAKIHPILDCLEQQLSQTDWLCGSTYSLADVTWTPILHQLDERKFSHLCLDDTRPALKSYFNRLKSRPSFVIAVENRMSSSMLLRGLCRIFIGI